MPRPYLVCINPANVDGCAHCAHPDNDRNQAIKEGRSECGSLWKDEHWALCPKCDICGQRRGRYEVGLFL